MPQGPGGSLARDGGRPQVGGPPVGGPVRSVKADRTPHPRYGIDYQPDPDRILSGVAGAEGTVFGESGAAVHGLKDGAGRVCIPLLLESALAPGYLAAIVHNL